MIAETGASWNASVPIAGVGTWPQITTMGIESAMRVAHRRDRIGGAGAGGDHAHADAAAGAGVTRRHEARTLLVGRDDQRHRCIAGLVAVFVVVAEDRVVGGQDRAAAVAEDRLHALVDEDLHDDLRTGHALAGQRVGWVSTVWAVGS